MRRIVMWFMSTVTVVVLLFGYHTSTSGPSSTAGAAQPVISSTPSSSAAGSGPSGGASSGSASSGTGSTASAGSAATTVTGPSVDTRWGPVRVAVTTSGGKLTKIAVVEYPSGNSTDQQINSRALPILVRETLDQQSARIDMVSGATVTSDGYRQSLQAALDRAGQ
jgi:uncharacterized protein with FMN-binding domain